jgi:hypothetical protein
MFATIRRYDAIDQEHVGDLVTKVDESLMPALSELPGFSGYYFIDAGNGVMSSIGFFETAEQADDSARVAATWVREQKLENIVPNEPKITTGEVVVQKTAELVQA